MGRQHWQQFRFVTLQSLKTVFRNRFRSLSVRANYAIALTSDLWKRHNLKS